MSKDGDQNYIDWMNDPHRLNKRVLELEAECAAEKLRANRAVEHSTEMESRAWATEAKAQHAEAERAAEKLRADKAEAEIKVLWNRLGLSEPALSELQPQVHKMEMQLHAAREERDEIRAELKDWMAGHPASLCSAHQVLNLKCRMCNSALIQLDEVLAACAEMREVLTLCGAEQLVSVDGSRIDAALAADAGKGWVSPEEHRKVVAELRARIFALRTELGAPHE